MDHHRCLQSIWGFCFAVQNMAVHFWNSCIVMCWNTEISCSDTWLMQVLPVELGKTCFWCKYSFCRGIYITLYYPPWGGNFNSDFLTEGNLIVQMENIKRNIEKILQFWTPNLEIYIPQTFRSTNAIFYLKIYHCAGL